jgi:hypothetical protein
MAKRHKGTKVVGGTKSSHMKKGHKKGRKHKGRHKR